MRGGAETIVQVRELIEKHFERQSAVASGELSRSAGRQDLVRLQHLLGGRIWSPSTMATISRKWLQIRDEFRPRYHLFAGRICRLSGVRADRWRGGLLLRAWSPTPDDSRVVVGDMLPRELLLHLENAIAADAQFQEMKQRREPLPPLLCWCCSRLLYCCSSPPYGSVSTCHGDSLNPCWLSPEPLDELPKVTPLKRSRCRHRTRWRSGELSTPWSVGFAQPKQNLSSNAGTDHAPRHGAHRGVVVDTEGRNFPPRSAAAALFTATRSGLIAGSLCLISISRDSRIFISGFSRSSRPTPGARSISTPAARLSGSTSRHAHCPGEAGRRDERSDAAHSGAEASGLERGRTAHRARDSQSAS